MVRGSILLLCLVLTSVCAKEIKRNTNEGKETNVIETSDLLHTTNLNEFDSKVPELTKRAAEKDKVSVEERKIERQINQLKKMKCKPKRQKIDVASAVLNHFGGRTKILEKPVIPEVLAIKKCDPQCSSCADKRGRERKICQPTKQKKKKYTIKYYGEDGKREYTKIPILIDEECKCLKLKKPKNKLL